jgi:hypothetical protein
MTLDSIYESSQILQDVKLTLLGKSQTRTSGEWQRSTQQAFWIETCPTCGFGLTINVGSVAVSRIE